MDDRERTPDREFGIRYRAALWPWLSDAASGSRIQCIELDAADAVRGGHAWLRTLADRFAITLFDLTLSLVGHSAMPADQCNGVATLAGVARPRRISTPLGFTTTGGRPSPLPLPTSLDTDALERAVDRAHRLSALAGAVPLVRNIASPLRIVGGLRDTDWLNRFCDGAHGGVAVDVAALDVEARCHGFDAAAWLRELDPRHVLEIHAGGGNGDEDVWLGRRRLPPGPDVLTLTQAAMAHAPCASVILQCTAGEPPLGAMLDTLDELRQRH
ncbi:MAG: DUF692 family protein [Burkholderiales bacterium]